MCFPIETRPKPGDVLQPEGARITERIRYVYLVLDAPYCMLSGGSGYDACILRRLVLPEIESSLLVTGIRHCLQ